MLKIQSGENKIKTKINPKNVLIWIVSVIIFFILTSSVVELFIKYRNIRKNIKELKSDQIALKEKKDLLVSTNDYIKTPEGQERVFRDKFRLIKPGEGIIVITEPELKEVQTQKKPILRRFWDSLRLGLGI